MEWIVLVIFVLWLFGRASRKQTVAIGGAHPIGCGGNVGGDSFPGCVSPPVSGVCGTPVHPPIIPTRYPPIHIIGPVIGPTVTFKHQLTFPIDAPPPIAVQATIPARVIRPKPPVRRVLSHCNRRLV
jgi:hypothetical protein